MFLSLWDDSVFKHNDRSRHSYVMTAAATTESLADAAELRACLQESWKSDPSLWESVLGEEHAATLTEVAEAVCEQLLHDDAHLTRILVARQHQKEPSEALFWEQVHFRAQYRPDQITPSQIPTALPSGAWRLCGYTVDGYVLANYRLDCWNPDAYGTNLEDAVQEYILYICYMIERMIQAQTKHSRFSLIFDLSGFYMSMVLKENIRHMVYQLIYVAQAQYPERLEKVYMVNAPWGFESAWSLIKPLLDAKTASKVHFCGKPDQLLEDIDADSLSVAYGGNHDEYPIPI